jgi:predicted MFS family arabinose efflux permease
MVLGWHAYAFLCILAMAVHVTIPSRLDIPEDPKSNKEPGGSKDVHDDTRVLEYLCITLICLSR